MTDRAGALGRGFAFPPSIGTDGRWEWSTGPENIRQSIRIILGTERQERVMRPAFGGGLKRFLFQPNTTAVHRLIEETILQTLGRWEPRVSVQRVDVGPDPAEADAVLARISYRVVQTGTDDTISVQVRLS
ncbi:MAG: GPW/gp25 family protein [Pseudomonadota bacterium]